MDLITIGNQTVSIAPEAVGVLKTGLVVYALMAIPILAFIGFVFYRVFKGFRDFDRGFDSHRMGRK